MPPVRPQMLVLEAEAERNRRELAASIGEIGFRLQPRNLFAAAQKRAGEKAREGLGAVGEAVRGERGKAMVLAVGAAMAFYLGRATRGFRPSSDSAAASAGSESAASNRTRSPRSGRGLSGQVGTYTQGAKSLASALGAVATGYAIASAAPISQPERDLMGEASLRARAYAADFRRDHARGARLLAAQAFGVARVCAALIGIVGALGGLLAAGEKPVKPSDASL